MKYIKQLFLALFITLCTNLSAQINATTEDGQRVILADDGTWLYAPATTENSLKEIKSHAPGCGDYVTTLLDERTNMNYKTIPTVMLLSEEDESQWILIDVGTSSIPSLKNVVLFTFSPFGSGECIKDENKIVLQFENGDILEFENDAMYNCNNRFMLYFGGTYKKEKELAKLSQLPLANIKIETQDGSVHKVFTDEQRVAFQKSIQCLVESL